MIDAEVLVEVAKEAMRQKVKEELDAELHKMIQPAIDNIVAEVMKGTSFEAYLERVLEGFGGSNNLKVEVRGLCE